MTPELKKTITDYLTEEQETLNRFAGYLNINLGTASAAPALSVNPVQAQTFETEDAIVNRFAGYLNIMPMAGETPVPMSPAAQCSFTAPAEQKQESSDSIVARLSQHLDHLDKVQVKLAATTAKAPAKSPAKRDWANYEMTASEKALLAKACKFSAVPGNANPFCFGAGAGSIDFRG